MSRWLEDVGERVFFYRVAFLSLASCTVFAVLVALYLMDQKKIGLAGAAGVIVVGWIVAGVVTAVVWTLSGAVSRGLVQTMTGAGNLAPAPSFSLQESLVARGRYQEAASREVLLEQDISTEPENSIMENAPKFVANSPALPTNMNSPSPQ